MSGGGRLFRAFFLVCLTLIGIWLVSGIAPYFAHRSVDLHSALHRAGGAVRDSTLEVVNHPFEQELVRLPDRLPHVDPALAEFGSVELTVRAGRQATVLLDNKTIDDHSIVIYADRTYRRPVFTGRPVPGTRRSEFDSAGRRIEAEPSAPPAHEPYRFTLPTPGAYWYRCGVYAAMRFGRVSEGRITALAPGVGPDHNELGSPSWSPSRQAHRIAAESHRAQGTVQVAADYTFSILNVVLAIVLMRLKPRDRVARLFALGMLATAAAYNLQSHSAPSITPIMASIHPGMIHPLSGLAYVYAFFTFPDGKLVPRWRNPGARIAYAAATFIGIALLLDLAQVTGPAPQVGHAVNFLQFFGVLVPLVGFATQGYRYQRAETAEARQQSRLILFALVPVFLVGVVLVVLDATIRLDDTLVFRTFQPVFALIPVALFLGIIRYRLWDIDLVVNKTILYGSLAAFIGVVSIGVIVGIGQALPVEANVPLQIGTMVIVAVAFESVRERLQRLANRLVYGERASPYEVMADLSHRLAGAFSVEEALPKTAEAAARGLGAARVRVRVTLPDGGERTADWPAGVNGDRFDRVLEVPFRGEPIGEIAVAKRPGESLSAAEDRLLNALAAQAGIAFHSARLSHALQGRLDEISSLSDELATSRGRIHGAQIAERRRLESEISEAVEAPLARILRRLEDVSGSRPTPPPKAAVLLDHVIADAVEVQERLRNISRGVFPPLLSDKGLVVALESQARALDPPGRLKGQETIAGLRFDPEAEAAVYFCCVQAIRNAGRTGGDITVALSLEGNSIGFSVAYRGAPPDDFPGLSDRVEALGGTLAIESSTGRGTRISGTVPAARVVQAGVA